MVSTYQLGVITKSVNIRWHGRYRKHYEDKGYTFSNYGDYFTVDVKDLPNGSHAKIVYSCDKCGNKINTQWNLYLRYLKEDKYAYCNSCSTIIFGVDKAIKTRLKNSISFKQWCYDNLDNVKSDEIMQRWDYEKNKCSPDEVCFKSNRKYWFKCLVNKNHGSELKNIGSFVRDIINFKIENSKCLNCNLCYNIKYTHPELIKYFARKEDINNSTYGIGKKVLLKCPDCGFTKYMTLNNLSRQGFYCNRCSDGVSYPEKFTLNFLEQLNIDFVTQYGKTSEKWCGNYKYDFYLPSLNIIIEVHGDQHYSDYKSWDTDVIQNNDINKQNIAINNGIEFDKYIIIDARKSTLNYIKHNILKSNLSKYFNLDIIDWNKCEIAALSNKIKETCNLWNSGITSRKELSKLINVHPCTIYKYLKLGNEIGWCKYKPYDFTNYRKPIICVNTGELFKSSKEAALKYNHHVNSCLHNKRKTAGKHPITGEALKWMYYDKYLSMIEGDITVRT